MLSVVVAAAAGWDHCNAQIKSLLNFVLFHEQKSIGQGVTKRECVAGLSTVTSCVPIPGSVYICDSDKCNAGNSLVSRGAASIGVFAAIAAAIGRHFLH